MTKILAAAGIGAALLTGGCGSAEATPATDRAVCSNFESAYQSVKATYGSVLPGETYLHVVDHYEKAGMNRYEAQTMVQGSIDLYCPQYSGDYR